MLFFNFSDGSVTFQFLPLIAPHLGNNRLIWWKYLCLADGCSQLFHPCMLSKKLILERYERMNPQGTQYLKLFCRMFSGCILSYLSLIQVHLIRCRSFNLLGLETPVHCHYIIKRFSCWKLVNVHIVHNLCRPNSLHTNRPQPGNGPNFYLWSNFSCQFLLRHIGRHLRFGSAQFAPLKIVEQFRFLRRFINTMQLCFLQSNSLKVTL